MNGKVPDDHKGKTEKDSAWKRFDLNVRSAPGSEEVASGYLTIQTSANLTVPTDGGESADGYKGLGGFRSASGTTLTFTFNCSEACEVGLYGQFAYRSTAQTFDQFGTITVNGAEVPCASVNMPVTPEGGAEYTTSNNFTFLGYIQLKAGENVIVITRGSVSNGSYNFWGIRLTAEKANITMK